MAQFLGSRYLCQIGVMEPSKQFDFKYQEKQIDHQLYVYLTWVGDPAGRLRIVKDYCKNLKNKSSCLKQTSNFNNLLRSQTRGKLLELKIR